MEGQARTTTKRAGSNPWLAAFAIGHGGVICPTTAANSSRSFGLCCSQTGRQDNPATMIFLVLLHFLPQFHGLAEEKKFVLLVLSLAIACRWVLGLKCWASTQWWDGGFISLSSTTPLSKLPPFYLSASKLR